MVITRSKEKKFYTELKSTGHVCCRGTDKQIEARGAYFEIPKCCVTNFIKLRKDFRHKKKFRGRWPRSFKSQVIVRLNGWNLCQQCTYYISKNNLFFGEYQFIPIE